MNKEKEHALHKAFEQFMDMSLMQMHITEDADKVIAKDIMGYGTTLDEVINSFEDWKALINLQIEQGAQLDFRFDRSPYHKRISDLEDTALIVETIATSIIAVGFKNEFTFRISVLLEYTSQNIWQVIHWHGSIPSDTENDSWHVNEWKKKNELLEKEVQERTAELEAKNRELEIEAALEKVRAQAMAMHNSEDMGQCILKMFNELTALGVDKGTRFGIGILNDDNENNQLWTAIKEGDEINMHIGHLDMSWHPLLQSARKAWKAQVPLHKYVLEGEDLLNYYKMINEAPDYKLQVAIDKLPEREIHYGFIFKHGFFYAFCPNEFQPELIHITQRFSSLFSQTYTRFLDLQKAEAQAIEANIQLALERVRAKSMAMKTQSDLLGIIELFGEQLSAVDVRFDHVTFIEGPITKERDWDLWSYVPEAENTTDKILIPYTETPYFTKTAKAVEEYQKTGQPIQVKTFTKNEKNEFLDHYWKHAPAVSDEIADYVYATSGSMIVDALLEEITVSMVKWNSEPYSDEELAIFERFAKEFKQTYIRFLDLKKAEAQAREAQIELSLERVRAKAMAMHNTKDLSDANSVVFNELNALGIKPLRSGIGLIDLETRKGAMYATVLSDQGNNLKLIGDISLTNYHVLDAIYDHWVKKQMYCQKLNGIELEQYYDVLLASYDDLPKPKFSKDENQYGYFLPFEHGDFYAWTQQPFDEEELRIINRFVSVIDLTYRRYFDLKKAEAQAREAQIEAALERVRSRSLAMHKSEELEEVILVVSEQLQQLQFKFHNVSFGFDNEQMGLNFWLASPGLPKPFLIKVPYIENPAFNRPMQARNNGIDFISDILSREENIQFLQHMFDHSDLSHLPVKTKNFLMSTTGIARSQCLMKNTILTIANYALSPYSEEQNAILRRFGNVFEQAYVRFLDLKKAEAQAKEAQVALSLERIRAQVTAMQESSDLFDIVVSMRKEFLSMGHEADYFWHMQWLPDAYDMSMTSDDGSRVGMVISIPKFVHEAIPDLDKWEKGDEPICVLPLNADAAWDYIENMNTHGRYELADPNAPSQEDIQHIGGLTFIIARTTHGEIGYSLAGEVPNPPKDALNTLERFAGVFDLAYKRFEDLKASEHQHRETQIELSLERIRAQAMAMKVSTDLLDIVVKMRTEFITLGHEAHYFWYMRWFPKKYEKAMTSGDGTKVGMVMELPRHIHGDIKLLADWEKSQEATVVYAMDPDMAVDYVDKMVTLGDFKQVDPNAPSADDIRHIGGLTFIMTKTTFGEIGYSLPGVVPNPPADDLNTLKRFASAFDLAYGRFEDLQKAEAQAIRAKKDLEAIKIARKKAEDALTELKSTQSQLIQSEKMASLGELTAGIAHEIQNPLNFVNNFSEVSNEMIKELQEERAKAKNEQDESLIDEILIDIEQNLSKINHHGNRAGDIVKGMLQHSRAGSGTKEPTDINLLADEYLRLAYHGLRAKNKSFNATMQTDFDESLDKINIVPQDIGRVILNLITNAFYVVNEKSKEQIEGYQPTVSVKTKHVSGKILISVKDNGGGIPEQVREKIFQPFFTTKPTGQGTGLGLSLSYDIVKAHGGELTVETKENEGSEFIIKLPV